MLPAGTTFDVVSSYGKTLIRESWQRCKVRPGNSPLLGISHEYVATSEIRQKIEALSEAIGISIDVVPRLQQISHESGLAVFVSDQSSTLLSGYLESSDASSIADKGLVEGSIWVEDSVGTNSLAISIATKRPLVVSGPEHYLESLRSLTCVTTPIQSPVGEVKGAIVAVGYANAKPALISLTHSLINELVADWEKAIFYRQFKDRYIVHARAVNPDSCSDGSLMVAVDNLGRILGVTGCGKGIQAFGDRACWIGRPLEDAVRISLSDLTRVSHAQPVMDVSGMGESRIWLEERSDSRQRKPGLSFAPIVSRRQEAPRVGPGPLDKVAGSDVDMQNIAERGKKFVDIDLPLILLGETGTGKDTFAKAMHAESKRSAKPFIAVNCAALPASLLDTELFGYASGTFTGGLKQGKIGKIAASHEGTLFLDEIGDMPMELQARLLHVLESREITPVGSTETQTVSIHVIAATNKDLPSLVKAGQFREDLYYRLNGAQLRMPPLRERTNLKELVDILVADEFKGESNLSFTKDAWNIFASYGWPGNIRQLKNTIKLLMCLSDNGQVTLNDLPEEILRSQPYTEVSIESPITTGPIPQPSTNHRLLDCHKMDVERQLILATLQECGGKITAAAKELGISRATMHRKMQKIAHRC